MPPRAVRMPWATYMPPMSSGLVSMRTSITFLPFSFHASASAALNTTWPQAAPGEAARPLARTLAFFLARGSMVGWRSWSICDGSTRRTASAASIRPSSFISTAIAQRGGRGALAGTGLEHPELILLDGELHVLHVLVAVLETRADIDQLLIQVGHDFLQRRQVGAGQFLFRQGQRLRGPDAGHHVLALGVDQVFAVVGVLAGRRVARETHAGGAVVAHVAEHHGLDIDGGAPMIRQVVQLAVRDGALVHPGAEHRADGAPQLLPRIGRERLAELLHRLRLVLHDQVLQVVGGHLGVELVALGFLVLLQDVLEILGIDVEHDVAVHLDEAAIAVIRETRIARKLGDDLGDFVVHAEVQHGVHHARHRRAARPSGPTTEADFPCC